MPPPIHAALLCIVLLMPGSSLHGWRTHAGPNLRAAMNCGALGLVNMRTAEKDAISARASCLSIGTGARVKATRDGRPIAVGLGYEVLGGNLGKSLSDAGVNVVASDPLARALCYGAHASSFVRGELIVEDLSREPLVADRQIGDFRRKVEHCGGMLVILSPNPTREAFNNFDRLTPILLVGPRGRSGDFVTSPSTRTKGLIANTDIAPTIAAFFGVPLEGPTYGAAVRSSGISDDAPRDLDRLNRRWIAQERMLALRPYIALTIAILIAIATALVVTNCALSASFAAMAAAIPFIMFLSRGQFLAGPLILLGVLVIGALRSYSAKTRPPVYWMARVMTIFFLVDAVAQGSFSAESLLGYSPVEGARYYGIGNEAMGAWLGAAALSAGAQVALVPGYRLAAGAALIAVALGHPLIGAKAGGFLAALVTILGFWWAQSGRAFRPVIAIVAVLAAIAAGMAIEIFMGRFGASHVTQAVAAAHHGGAGAVMATIARKAAMNLHLLTHSTWALLLGANLFGSWRLLQGVALEGRTARAMVFGTLSAVLASLLLNDAGVVAAAIGSLYLWSAAVSVRGETGTTTCLS